MDSSIFRSMSYGVYITTSVDDGRPVGCITNSNTQITATPATVSVSVNHNNHTTACIEKSGLLALRRAGIPTSSMAWTTRGRRASRLCRRAAATWSAA